MEEVQKEASQESVTLEIDNVKQILEIRLINEEKEEEDG